MSDQIKYEINGEVYVQDFLSIEEMIEFSEMISGDEMKQFKDKQFPELVKSFISSGKLYDFLNLILKGPEKITKQTRTKPSIILRSIKDFFLINEFSEITGDLLEAIMEFLGNEKFHTITELAPQLLSQMRKMTSKVKKSTGTTSSPRSQTETSANTATSNQK